MRKWLIERFLPMWAKQTVYLENQRLREENTRLRQSLQVRESYIRGMHAGLRRKTRLQKQGGNK